MSDERRSSGNGAVVAIVVVLGILFLGGLVVLVGGALLFVAMPVRSAPPLAAPVATKIPSSPEEMFSEELNFSEEAMLKDGEELSLTPAELTANDLPDVATVEVPAAIEGRSVEPPLRGDAAAIAVGPPVREPPLMRITVERDERVNAFGKNLSLEEFKTRMQEIKVRTPNQKVVVHVASSARQDQAFIQAVSDVCRELEFDFRMNE